MYEQIRFYHAFVNEFGILPNKLILTESIRYAKILLSSSGVNIKEVCFASGFSDPNYFTRIFKKMEGVTTGEYRLISLNDIN